MPRLSTAFGLVILLLVLTSCRSRPPVAPTETVPPMNTPVSLTVTASPVPLQSGGLTVCIGKEPSSLFLYGDTSAAARSVREAIYDGPFDVRDFASQPVILESMPKTADGDVSWEKV